MLTANTIAPRFATTTTISTNTTECQRIYSFCNFQIHLFWTKLQQKTAFFYYFYGGFLSSLFFCTSKYDSSVMLLLIRHSQLWKVHTSTCFVLLCRCGGSCYFGLFEKFHSSFHYVLFLFYVLFVTTIYLFSTFHFIYMVDMCTMCMWFHFVCRSEMILNSNLPREREKKKWSRHQDARKTFQGAN